VDRLDLRLVCARVVRHTLKAVPPTSRESVAPKERPLFLLSRDELGAEFALSCRVALGERRRSRGGGTLDWLRHPLVESVLTEITLRHYEELVEVEAQLSLADTISP